jgi:hypothetical protein
LLSGFLFDNDLIKNAHDVGVVHDHQFFAVERVQFAASSRTPRPPATTLPFPEQYRG